MPPLFMSFDAHVASYFSSPRSLANGRLGATCGCKEPLFRVKDLGKSWYLAKLKINNF